MKYIELFRNKMESENLPKIVIENFDYYYTKLINGEEGLLPEDSIHPVGSLTNYDSLDDDIESYGLRIKEKSVFLKLNGGLGTGMGLSDAKSLLKIKDQLTFLDIIAKQSEISSIPLILMNSFSTQEKSLKLLEKYPSIKNKLPIDFLQHKIPKISAESFKPAEYKINELLEWCPPGHGEIYTAMITSGILQQLLNQNIEYAFISNSDNLGAVMDYKILGYFAKNNFPFLMEVADRTEADKKGGHLAKLSNNQMILRESAQCPKNDIPDFQNIKKHKYFNTNNIWVNLKELQKVMNRKNNILGLPMIVNKKNINPKNSNSETVYQLETAMGSAISVFDGATAIAVPRSRFAPVKTTNDLLAIRSDNYILTNDFRVVENPKRKLSTILIDLDPRHYKMVDDLDSRIPDTPSLVNCKSLKIEGDYKIGYNVKFSGEVLLKNDKMQQLEIEDNSLIEN